MKKICTITLIGRPNVGKSSLLNKLINYDLSIISKHVQTTRDQIRGIYNDHECQFIFLDTPGIHKGKNLLSEKLNQKSYQALEESDLVMFLFPANEEIGKGDKYILHRIKDAQVNNVIGIITKIDLIKNKDILEEKVNQLKELGLKYYPSQEEVEEEIKKAGPRVQMLEFTIEHITGKTVHEK